MMHVLSATRSTALSWKVKYKNASELRIDGAQSEIMDMLGRGFDALLSRAGLDGGNETDDKGPMIDATVAVDTMIRVGSSHADKEKQLARVESEAREQASLLQTAYVEAVARKQAEFSVLLSERKARGVRLPSDWWVEMMQW